MDNTAPNKNRPSKDRTAVQSGLSDLLGNVIRNDRQQSGRGKTASPDASQPALSGSPADGGEREAVPSSPGSSVRQEADPNPTPSATPNVAIGAIHSDNTTDKQHDIMTNGQSDETSAIAADIPHAAPALSARQTPAPPDSLRRKKHLTAPSHKEDAPTRVAAAEELAETPTMTVTLRIPQGFNEWLDEYIHRSWPQKIRKQELVVEALRLLYARRGKAGEALIETALLGEASTEEES